MSDLSDKSDKSDKSDESDLSEVSYKSDISANSRNCLLTEQGKFMSEIIYTPSAPEPVGPYSQAVKTDGWLFVSGQIPIDPSTGEMVESDIAVQTRRALHNLVAVLQAAGAGLADVVKVTIFMADLAQFGEMNAVYGEYFQKNPPARACVQVGRLPKDSLLEIECIARV